MNSKVNQLIKKMHFLIQTRQADKALQVINSIIQLEPQKSFGYFEKGRIQTILMQYQDAENNLRMAIKIDPHQESYFIALANLLIENNKASEAVIPLEEALKINPKSHNATYYLGLAFKKLNSLCNLFKL
jgi:predicted Zn-dependent protease